jgi:hypothetical protein
MIEMPHRSVTRFFIPLIDVLTLLFCIYLLMPVVGPDATEGATKGDPALEITRLRNEREELRAEIARLKQRTPESPRLSVRLLQTGDKGRLYFSDPKKPDHRMELTTKNVQEFIDAQRGDAGRELYFLIVTPRIGDEIPVYPLRGQLEQYDHWFAAYAHGHIYYALPGK